MSKSGHNMIFDKRDKQQDTDSNELLMDGIKGHRKDYRVKVLNGSSSKTYNLLISLRSNYQQESDNTTRLTIELQYHNIAGPLALDDSKSVSENCVKFSCQFFQNSIAGVYSQCFMVSRLVASNLP